MKKSLLGMVCMALASLSFGAWYDGPLVVVPADSTLTAAPLKAYKYYRFALRQQKNTANRSASSAAYFEFTELALYDANGARINQGLTCATPSTIADLAKGSFWMHSSGNYSDTWNSACLNNGYKLFDGDTGTKLEGDVRHLYQEDPSCWALIDMRLSDDTKVADSYNLASGTDIAASSVQGRNLAAWAMFGSEDGTTWDLLDSVDVTEGVKYVPTTNRTWFNGNKVMPFSRCANALTLVGAEGTLAFNGSAAVGEAVVNGGAVLIAEGAEVSADVVAGVTNKIVGGGLAGKGTLSKSGAGTLEIGGPNGGFSGDFAVRGGTLRFAPVHTPRAFTYYRLNVLKKADFGNANFELSELALYGMDGKRVNLGLTRYGSGNSQPITSLTDGTFTVTENGSACSGSEVPANLFDGNTATKMFVSGVMTAKLPQVVMRLAAGVGPVVAYSMASGTDIAATGRQLTGWSLEGSFNGTDWVELDRVEDNARGNLVNCAWFNDGIPYPIMITGNRPLTHTTDAKYFRFSVKDIYNNDGNFELSEFALYDVAGNRVNLNLSSPGNSAKISSLQPGEMTLVENGGWCRGVNESEGTPKMFDGNASTKCFAGGMSVSGGKLPQIVMRLAADSAPVASYAFCTGNDCLKRTPVSWTLEASSDGTNWALLDMVTDASADGLVVVASKRWTNAGLPMGIGAGNALELVPVHAGFVLAADARLELPKSAAPCERLSVSCTSTVSIENFKAAVGMVLDLTDFRAFKSSHAAHGCLQDAELPLALTGEVDVSTLATWKVTFDGQERDCFELSYLNGKLCVTGGSGLVLMIR